MEILIGTGGWQYFEALGDPLINYSKVFDFCEINSTFYNFPELGTCKIWRNKVKNNKKFIFSVKVNRKITHVNKLNPTEENYSLFNKMKEICNILNSSILIFQTPDDLVLSKEKINQIDDFFGSISTANLNLVWEHRGNELKIKEIANEFKKILNKYNISHCVDLSKEQPLYISNMAYTRIFGPGEGNKYQFDDNEIININRRFNNFEKDVDRVIVSFHTQRMIHDAARAKKYNETGELIGVSGKIGFSSFIDALGEERSFPINKKQLILNHGWKIYDKSKIHRERIESVLNLIEDKTYYNIQEIISEIKNKIVL